MDLDYKKNQKYFKPMSLKPGLVLAAVGLLVLIAGPGAGKVVGLLILAGGAALIYFQFAGRPTDEEIDRAAMGVVRSSQQRAIAKLGLDEDQVKVIDPLLIDGYVLRNETVKRGKDGVFRTPRYEGVVLLFSEQQLYSYKLQFSLVEDGRVSEQTDEYFYRDVVSISTASDSIKVSEVGGGSKTVNLELFKLTTSGGTSVTSAIRDEGQVTRSLQGARQLIREKKSLV
ncbi:hypothetical protein GCM10027300_05300 [Modestobacter lapidis]